MASKFFKIVKFSLTYFPSCNCQSFKYITLLQSSRYINKISSIKIKSSQEKNRENSKELNYSLIVKVFSIVGLLYLFREKFNICSILPVAYALGKTNSTYRSRFNFIADVVEECGNGVVCIESHVRRLGSLVVIPRGSGFIVKEDGLIITNAHVVMNQPRSFQIKLKDGRIYSGQIEDVDLENDLATIRIQAKNLPVMKLGSSEDLRAGEWVIAIGSPFALTNSVSAGVVSAPQRKATDLGFRSDDSHYIQTDAHTTFGNSGGPLVNLDGEVIGVNTLKVTSGISFAIPVESVKKFLKINEEERKKEGDEKLKPNEVRGYLGIVMLTITPDLFEELKHKHYKIPDFLINNVLLYDVAFNTPAFRSGLQPGDIIVEVNGKKVEGVRSIYDALKEHVSLSVKIFRSGGFLNLKINPEEI